MEAKHVAKAIRDYVDGGFKSNNSMSIDKRRLSREEKRENTIIDGRNIELTNLYSRVIDIASRAEEYAFDEQLRDAEIKAQEDKDKEVLAKAKKRNALREYKKIEEARVEAQAIVDREELAAAKEACRKLQKTKDEDKHNCCTSYVMNFHDIGISDCDKKVNPYGELVDSIIKKSEVCKIAEKVKEYGNLTGQEIEAALSKGMDGLVKTLGRMSTLGLKKKEPKERKFKVDGLYPMKGNCVDYIKIVKYDGLFDGTHIFKEWKEDPDVIHINPNYKSVLNLIGKRIKFK